VTLPTTYIAASDDMKATTNAAWKAATLLHVGSVQKLFFQGIVKDGALEIGNPTDYWARVIIQGVTQGQSTLGEHQTGRRHTAYGLLWVQMFFPLAVNDAWRKGQLIASAVKNALARESISGTVWFLNPRINDNVPADVTHHRLNVVADYQFDEIL
jgi:hypothetical protein